jgi:hypothetical protein
MLFVYGFIALFTIGGLALAKQQLVHFKGYYMLGTSNNYRYYKDIAVALDLSKKA